VGRHWVIVLCVTACGRLDFDARSDASSDGTSDSGPLPNYVFVTSTRHLPTTFGTDLSGADAICNMRAMEAGIGGTYVAWLSTTTIDARTRLAGARGWIRTDGKPFVDTVEDLVTTSRIYYPLDHDENGVLVSAENVVTGTDDAGNMLPNCADYTDQAQTIYFGSVEGTAHAWTHESSVSCTMTSRIYCFGIDRDVTLTVPTSTGRIAFLTTGSFIPDPGGLATADNLCATEAAAAGITDRTFRALLATTTASAISRVSLSGPTWVRTDGIPIADTPTDLFNGNMLAPLNVTAGKTYRITQAFAGATNVASTSGAVQNCSNWTTSTGNGNVGLPSYISGYFFYDNLQQPACATGRGIYCLEQ
jgi:hypothetical protein